MLVSANHVVGLIEIDIDRSQATPVENELAAGDESLLGFLRRISTMTAESYVADNASSEDFGPAAESARQMQLTVSRRWRSTDNPAPAAQPLPPSVVYADFERLADDLDVEVERLQRQFAECRT